MVTRVLVGIAVLFALCGEIGPQSRRSVGRIGAVLREYRDRRRAHDLIAP